MNIIYYILLFSEIFHFISHSIILFRIYNPKVSSLIRYRYYFFYDMLCPILTLLYFNDISIPNLLDILFIFMVIILIFENQSSYMLINFNISFNILFIILYEIHLYLDKCKNFPLLLLLTVNHTLAHFMYFISWNSIYNYGYYPTRIRIWSSSEYTGRYYTYDFILTLYDVLLHLSMTILLLNYNSYIFMLTIHT